MSTRKIVQHGSSSLTITLPIKWINRNKLHKGEEIKITEKGSYLIVGGRGKEEKISKTIKIPSNVNPSVMKHYTASLYRAGYDSVKFIYDNAEIYQAIESVTGSDLSGWEIIENKKNSCIIESVAVIDQSLFENIFKKMLYNLSEFSKDSLEAINNGDINAIKMAQTKEQIINRNANFCERILIKDGYKDPEKIPFLFYIIKELENIGDEYNQICKYYLDSNKIDKKTRKSYGEINEMVEVFKKLYLKEEIDKPLSIENASSLYTKIQEKTKEMYDSLKENGKDDCILHHLLSIARRMKSCLGCLFSIMIVEEQTK